MLLSMLQEPEVLYALPEDRLAAWFYMHALVCANPRMIPWMNSQHNNAGMLKVTASSPGRTLCIRDMVLTCVI